MIINNKFQLCQQSLDQYVLYLMNKYSSRNVYYIIYRCLANEKMFYLEEERDFFRAQVIKLNEDLRKMTEENNKLKLKLSETRD